MLNLPAVAGRMAIRTDIGKTFVLAEEPASVLENWIELQTSSAVESVNGRTGNVEVTKADVGLGNVDNTADADKPLATQEVPGLLPPEDKKKLDEASSTPPPVRDVGTLIPVLRRHPALVMYKEGVGAGGGTFEVDEPSLPANPATRNYVDKLVALRGSREPQATIDLDTIINPGVYNVSRNSPNLPVFATLRAGGRLEVETYASSITYQTLRLGASGIPARNDTDMRQNSLILSNLTFKRARTPVSAADDYAWTPWVCEGMSPWLSIVPKPVNTHIYGVSCSVDHYPPVTGIPAGPGAWRINNGNVEVQLIITATGASESSGFLDIANVSPELSSPSGTPVDYYVSAETAQYRGISGAVILYNRDRSMLRLKLRGEPSATSTAHYAANGLTWPVEIKNYGGN